MGEMCYESLLGRVKVQWHLQYLLVARSKDL